MQELEQLTKCTICPHSCGINRLAKQKGRCGAAADTVRIALASIHHFEEPCISASRGSGTVFFSHCTMKCEFCQNYEISQLGKGKEITIEELAAIFLRLQEKQVHNINLVTPTSYGPQIRRAIDLARKRGLHLPIVYNTNGYETVETVKKWEGYVDIYLPDLKYADDGLAKRLSHVEHYFATATQAILEMQRQVGDCVLDKEGVMQKGIIIRHLILPNHVVNTRNVLKWINDYLPDVYVSIMAQYFPTYRAKEIEEINRKITKEEYQQVVRFLDRLVIKNGYLQDLGEHEEEYVPKWEDEFWENE